MKPVLVFDWNGTLLDDTYALLETTNVILDRFGRPSIDIKTFRDRCDVPLSRLYHSLGMPQEEVEAVEHDEGALFHDTYEPLAAKADLREGARRVLELAQRESALLIILSNHIVAPLKSQLRRLGVDNYITDVLAFIARQSGWEARDNQDGESVSRRGDDCRDDCRAQELCSL
ncbi:HAD family hydrolase [Bradyrhizobium sp. USDA 4471]